jgi:hypothetical protein
MRTNDEFEKKSLSRRRTGENLRGAQGLSKLLPHPMTDRFPWRLCDHPHSLASAISAADATHQLTLQIAAIRRGRFCEGQDTSVRSEATVCAHTMKKRSSSPAPLPDKMSV